MGIIAQHPASFVVPERHVQPEIPRDSTHRRVGGRSRSRRPATNWSLRTGRSRRAASQFHLEQGVHCRGSDVTGWTGVAGPPRALDLFRRASLAAGITLFNILATGVATMSSLATILCVGCGQVLDELESSDSRPPPIAAEVYREVYGARFTDFQMIKDVCASCAGLLAIRTPH